MQVTYTIFQYSRATCSAKLTMKGTQAVLTDVLLRNSLHHVQGVLRDLRGEAKGRTEELLRGRQHVNLGRYWASNLAICAMTQGGSSILW